jgi:hypothetical protein
LGRDGTVGDAAQGTEEAKGVGPSLGFDAPLREGPVFGVSHCHQGSVRFQISVRSCHQV